MITRLLIVLTLSIISASADAQSIRYYQNILLLNQKVVKGSPTHVCSPYHDDNHMRGMIGIRRKKNRQHSLYFSYSLNQPFVGICLGEVIDAADVPPGNTLPVDIRRWTSEGDSHMYGLGYGIESKTSLGRLSLEIIGILNIEHAVETDFRWPVDWAFQSYSGYYTTGVASFHAGVQPVPELLLDMRCRLLGGLYASMMVSVRYGYHKTATASGIYRHLPSGFREEVEWVATPSAIQYGVGLTYDFQWRKSKE